MDRMAGQLPEGLHYVMHPSPPFHYRALGHCRPDLARPSLHPVDQPPAAIRTQSATVPEDCSISSHLSTLSVVAVL